jgi:hypothetical protein
MSQLLTLFWLRYAVFKNSLSSRREAAKTIFNLLFLAGMLLLSLLGGLSLLVAVVFFAEFRDLALAGGMATMLGGLLFLMLVTQSTGASAHFDPRRFILFPVPLGKLFFLNLISALAEAVMIMMLPSVAGLLIGLGIALREPLAGVIAFVCAVAWIDGLFVFVGLLTAWLLAGRQRRTEIFFGLLIGVMIIGGQLLPRLAETALGQTAWRLLNPYFSLIGEALAWTPLSVWPYFFEQVSQGGASQAYLRLLTVSAVFTGLVWAGGYAVFTRLATSARASSSATTNRSGEQRMAPSLMLTLTLPFASGQLAALLAKELLYLARNTAVYLNAASVLVITLVVFGDSSRAGGFGLSGAALEWWDGFRVAIWVVYAFVPNLQQFVNVFGYDAAGFRQYLLAPISWRRLLLSKNLAHGLLVGAQIALILVGAQIFYGGLTWGKVYIALCAALAEVAIYGLAGNFLSISFPFRAEFGIRTRRSNERFSATNMITLFGLMFGTLGLFVVPFLLSYLFQSFAVKYLAFTLIAAAACGLYLLRLGAQSRRLEARRFEIAEALTRKTEKV